MDENLEDPADVVRSIFRALNAGEWGAVAAYITLEELNRFRRYHLEFIRIQMEAQPRTVEEFARDVPGVPPEQLETLAADEAAAMERERRWRRPEYMGVSNLTPMQQLPPRVFFERWLDAEYRSTPDWHAGTSSGVGRRTVNRVVLGSVMEEREGCSTWAHVVYRQHDDPEFPSTVAVATLRHAEDGWRICADYELLLPAYYPRDHEEGAE